MLFESSAGSQAMPRQWIAGSVRVDDLRDDLDGFHDCCAGAIGVFVAISKATTVPFLTAFRLALPSGGGLAGCGSSFLVRFEGERGSRRGRRSNSQGWRKRGIFGQEGVGELAGMAEEGAAVGQLHEFGGPVGHHENGVGPFDEDNGGGGAAAY